MADPSSILDFPELRPESSKSKTQCDDNKTLSKEFRDLERYLVTDNREKTWVFRDTVDRYLRSWMFDEQIRQGPKVSEEVVSFRNAVVRCGHQMADRLADVERETHPDLVRCSDLLRAITAAICLAQQAEFNQVIEGKYVWGIMDWQSDHHEVDFYEMIAELQAIKKKLRVSGWTENQ